MKKGDLVYVICEKDGNPYKCKVLKAEENRIRIHYMDWNKRFDKWIGLDDQNLLTRRRSLPNDVPREPLNLSSNSEAERLIDHMYASLPAVVDQAGGSRGSSTPDGTLPLSQPQSSSANVRGKRTRNDDSSATDEENTPKRPLLNASVASPGLNVSDHLVIRESGDQSPVSERLVGPPSPINALNRSLSQPIGATSLETAVSENQVVESVPSSQRVSTSHQPSIPSGSLEATSTPVNGQGVAIGGVEARVPDNSGICCGLCQLPINRTKVKCSKCGLFFHGEPICLGVGVGVVSVLLADEVGAVLYQCCSCRCLDAPGNAGVVQLTRIVGELVGAFRRGGLGSSASDQAAVHGRGIEREELISQIREMREREKRKDSIIFRGLGNIPVDGLAPKFRQICSKLDLDPITLVDVKKISSANLFRARIEDAERRRELLLRCHRLRSSEEFSRVFINKDLTFQQREQLRAKRSALNRYQGGNLDSEILQGLPTGANALPIGGGPSSTTHLGGTHRVVPVSRQSLSDRGSSGRRGSRGGRGSSGPRGSGRSRGASGRRGSYRGRGGAGGGRDDGSSHRQPHIGNIPHLRRPLN